MKRSLFIILVTVLIILVLLYFYNEREEILNRKYSDDKIFIEYPYFNKKKIDNYITNYIGKFVNIDSNYLFIDYDYEMISKDIYLTMYVYRELGNIVSRNNLYFIVNLERDEIVVKDLDAYSNLEYDIYYQKYIDKDNKMIALTFDDGPNYNTSEVLDILEKYNVKATFFVLGCNIRGNEKIIKRMNDLGMEIGNHMYSHKLISSLSDDVIVDELKSVDDMIFSVIGKYPTLIRPSYGSYNNRFKKIVDRPIITWNVDTLDWKYHNSKRIANRIFNKVSDGSVILMHDIYNASKNSLEIIIPKLLDSGYQFVTVTELMYYKNK